jgi:DNA-binding NarL/FixJ family response regulator
VQAEETTPLNVALVDLALPGMSGAELTRSLLKEDPELRIVLYTARRTSASSWTPWTPGRPGSL